MTAVQLRKIIAKVSRLESDIEKLEEVRIRLASSEYASATISAGSGSKSYTRADLSKVDSTIKTLKRQLTCCRKLLNGESQGVGKMIYTVYC